MRILPSSMCQAKTGTGTDRAIPMDGARLGSQRPAMEVPAIIIFVSGDNCYVVHRGYYHLCGADGRDNEDMSDKTNAILSFSFGDKLGRSTCPNKHL
jgi:hypothetical protein